MAMFIGRLVLLAVVGYLIYLWWMKPRYTERQDASPVRRVSCLPGQHPANMPNDIGASYVKHWYRQHDMAEEMNRVAALGSKEEMQYYLAHLAFWLEQTEIK